MLHQKAKEKKEKKNLEKIMLHFGVDYGRVSHKSACTDPCISLVLPAVRLNVRSFAYFSNFFHLVGTKYVREIFAFFV